MKRTSEHYKNITVLMITKQSKHTLRTVQKMMPIISPDIQNKIISIINSLIVKKSVEKIIM